MANPVLEQAKSCSKCQRILPLTNFAKSSQTRSGVRSACKSCCSAAEARRLRARGIAPLKIKLSCYDCGALFIRTATLRTRCDDCRDIRKRSLARAAGKRTYDKGPVRARRPEERRAANKRFAERHPGAVRDSSRRYNDANRDLINSKARDRNRTAKRKAYMAKWDLENRAKPRVRLDQRMKTAVAIALKGGKAGRSWEKLVGYSLFDLALHVERQFMPGMSWHNMGDWHIDHIIPKSSFDYKTADDPEFRAAWALTNLRPLWALDNLSKGAQRLLLV